LKRCPFDTFHQRLEITGRLEITRRSDGASVGFIEIDTEQTPTVYKAKRYKEADSDIVEERVGSDFYAHIRWIGDNPNIPDPTVDPDVVRLQKDMLMRIVERVPGGGVVAVPYNKDIGPLWRAYRNGEICGDLTPATRRGEKGWVVTSIQRDWQAAVHETFEGAMDDVADAALGPNPTAHERLERERQKAADRAAKGVSAD
jgi:hypothetical protein